MGLGWSVDNVMHSLQNEWPHSLKHEAPFRTSWQIAQIKPSPGIERKISVGWPIASCSSSSILWLVVAGRFLNRNVVDGG